MGHLRARELLMVPDDREGEQIEPNADGGKGQHHHQCYKCLEGNWTVLRRHRRESAGE